MGYKDQQPTGNINEVSRIATGTVFKGEIESKSDIRIDGTFDGKINSTGRVVVGEGANVKGEIVCGDADIFRFQSSTKTGKFRDSRFLPGILFRKRDL